MFGCDISYNRDATRYHILLEVRPSAILQSNVIAHCEIVRMRAWVDLALMFLTFFLSIVWNVEVGIVVSVIISLLLVVHRSSRTRMTILVSFIPLHSPLLDVELMLPQGRIPGTTRWKPITDNPEAMEDVPGALIVRLRENLHFGALGVILLLPCQRSNGTSLNSEYFTAKRYCFSSL